jgi:hypothetical protein
MFFVLSTNITFCLQIDRYLICFFSLASPKLHGGHHSRTIAIAEIGWHISLQKTPTNMTQQSYQSTPNNRPPTFMCQQHSTSTSSYNISISSVGASLAIKCPKLPNLRQERVILLPIHRRPLLRRRRRRRPETGGSCAGFALGCSGHHCYHDGHFPVS